jgi:O-antigen/teichoic acid export membrane protein
MSDNGKIKRGISYLVLEKGVTGCITVVLLPLIIRAVGIDTFGLWGILLGLFGYFLCFDVGVTVSIERYIAFYKARNDTAKLQEIFSTAFTYLLLICIILFLLIFFGGRLILSSIIHDTSVTTNLLLLCYPGIAANMLLFAFISIPRGFQLFNLSSKIQITGKVIFALSVLLLLHYRPTITSLIIAFNLQSCTQLLLYVYISKKVAPYLKILRVGLSAAMLKTLINFGYKIQISFLSSLVTLHFDKMLLSYFFGLRYVGYYEAATRIVYAIRDIPMFLISVVMPRVSELASRNNMPEIRKLYLTIIRQLALFSFFLMAVLLSLGTTVIELLIKESANPFTYLVYIVLTVSCFWHVISAGALYTARGIGKSSVDLVSSVTSLLLNVVFSLILLRLFSYNGVVFGTAIAMIISPLVCYYLVNQAFSLPMAPFFSTSFKNQLIYSFVISCIIFFGLLRYCGTLPLYMRLVFFPTVVMLFSHLYYSLTRDPSYKELTSSLLSLISRIRTQASV